MPRKVPSMKTHDSGVTPVGDVHLVNPQMLRFLVDRMNDRARKLDEEEVELRRRLPENQMRIGTVVGVVKPRKRRVHISSWKTSAEQRKPSWFE